MQRRIARSLEPHETVGLIFATRVGTGYLNEKRSDFFFGSCFALVAASILVGCVMAFLAAVSAADTVVMFAVVVFFLLLLAAGASVLVSHLYHEKQTFCFTDRRLIVTMNKPSVPPRSIPYARLTRLAVHVLPDALRIDDRPAATRAAEYADRFNHPERWPRVGGMKEWFSTWNRVLPVSGMIRFYAGDELLVQIRCASTLRQRIERIRHLVGRPVEVDAAPEEEDEE